MLITLSIRTGTRTEFVDITSQVQKAVARSGVESGICYLFIPHTTAGLTLNENWDANVRDDMARALNRLVPASGDYRHAEGNSPAHVQASLLGSSLTLIIDRAELVLGTWQGVYLAEFDGPRQRQVLLKITRS